MGHFRQNLEPNLGIGAHTGRMDAPHPHPETLTVGIGPSLDFFRIFLGINSLCFASPLTLKSGVLGAHPCPDVVTTAGFDDALSFSRIGASVRPTDAKAALWPPSGAK